MTTVGFGDVIPLSQPGRILTVVMIINGVIIIPWQIGEFIKQLIKTATHINYTCPKCNLSLHDSDANFCKICGTQLNSNLLDLSRE
jgi:voltage-gated potassium channel